MKTLVNDVLRREASLFAFRFACEDCAHFSNEDGPRCSLGYPPAPRREALRENHIELCKSFELG
jgi:hypothetical protein